jgi:hypothetical protein
MLSAMNPPASNFTMFIATAQSLAATVSVRDDLYLRPAFARKAVAARLASGLVVLRAFLRRLILLMALDLEWGLVEARGPMKRPHGRKSKVSKRFALPNLDAQKASPWLNAYGPQFQPRIKSQNEAGTNPPVYIDMAKLYAKLDYFAKIAANPHAKAKRLAYHLARTYQGMIIAWEGPKRIAGRWGTQVRTYYDAMAAFILEQSRHRPPPLPPPRTHWPMITAL